MKDEDIMHTASAFPHYVKYDKHSGLITQEGTTKEVGNCYVNNDGTMEVVLGTENNKFTMHVNLPATVLIKMLSARMKVELARGKTAK